MICPYCKAPMEDNEATCYRYHEDCWVLLFCKSGGDSRPLWMRLAEDYRRLEQNSPVRHFQIDRVI